jgi:hypothetical protein
MIRGAQRLSLSFALTLTLTGCAHSPQVWFTPNIGSPDMLDLFEHPEEWPKARSEIQVFGFYAGQLVPDELACPNCGPNRIENLRRVSAFARLAQWGISTYIEAPAVKPWDCTAETPAVFTRDALRAASEGGGAVHYVAMDEPLLGGDSCGLTMNETARRTAAYVHKLQAEQPGLSIGDIEPYPVIPAPRLLDWMDALRSAGVIPAFFHLDVDRAYAASRRLDIGPDLRLLKTSLGQSFIPFGLILWGSNGSSDDGYATDVTGWAQEATTVFGAAPDHITFQSWVVSPDGAQRVPVNLPENDPTTHSHTRLINETLAQLRKTW